ncbi:hypothetical protein QUA30_15455 [Microcoleus sp. Pol14C2]|uniref:hypothetical protein n=1 Tax=unclassified Microcoleus TaxID=2642155 RepID=UPI002FD59E8D
MAFLDTVREQLKPDDTKAREQLDFLKKVAQNQLELFRMEFLERFRNPEGFKEEILPKQMFEHTEQYRVDIDEGAAKEIDGIVDSFFTGTEDSVKDGFKNLIKFAFKAILGSSQIGESLVNQWFITLEYGALIRVDLMSWRYNFSGEGIIANAKNAYCFTITKSFVDTRTLVPGQLIYFVAKSVGAKSIEDIKKNPVLMDYVKFLQDGWDRNKPIDIAMADYHASLKETTGRALA